MSYDSVSSSRRVLFVCGKMQEKKHRSPPGRTGGDVKDSGLTRGVNAVCETDGGGA